MYAYLKALHIIFVVTWFAGLFYTVRLFIYHVEASAKEDPERSILTKQFKLMSKRLWFGITWPSAILTGVFAIWMLTMNTGLLKMGWMHIKLTFVFLLYVYHIICHRMLVNLQNDRIKYTSTGLRIWNEVATIILVSVVFLIVLRNALNWLWGLLGLVAFSIALMLAIRIYRKLRQP